MLALALGTLCALAISACGEDSSTESSEAQQLIEQTVRATSASLDNGRLDARLQLEPEGLLALGGPILLEVRGPFVAARGDGPPRVDLAAAATLARKRYAGGVLSDGRRAFLELDGRAYRLDERSLRRLESLGLDPPSWLKGERTRGRARIAGVDTIRVTGTVNVARLLDDLDGLVPAQTGRRFADAVRSARFELWTGAEDKILRQLVVRVALEVRQGAEPPIPGLKAGRVQLRVRLGEVNGQAAEIKAPARALPFSRVPTDRGLGGLLECLGASGSPRSPGPAGVIPCVITLDP